MKYEFNNPKLQASYLKLKPYLDNENQLIESINSDINKLEGTLKDRVTITETETDPFTLLTGETCKLFWDQRPEQKNRWRLFAEVEGETKVLAEAPLLWRVKVHPYLYKLIEAIGR